MLKTCLDCKHVTFSPGQPNYSEWTPGYDADFYCMRNHWVLDAFNESLSSLREKLYRATTCIDFEQEGNR